MFFFLFQIRDVLVLLFQLIHHSNGACFVIAILLAYLSCLLLVGSNWRLRMCGFVFAGAMGFSLSIASIPLSGGYTFVGKSYVAPVVFSTGFASVAAPHLIAASFADFSSIELIRQELVWSIGMAVFACCSAFLQQGHLFVWSVFGPLVAWQAFYLLITSIKIAIF